MKPARQQQPSVITGPDFGPAVVRKPSGALRHLPLANQVVIEDRPDPSQPDRGRTPITVRGARRYDGILAMFGSRSPQFIAAERFRDDCAKAGGARAEAGEASVRLAFDPGRYGPSDAQIDAQARARAAWQAMGLVATGVVSWVVLGNGSLATYEQAKGGKKGRASMILGAALDRLVAHYDAADR